MKTILIFSHLRELYVHAVSNLSWGYEVYIVALEIDEDESFQAVLKRLNNAFGIGGHKTECRECESKRNYINASKNTNLDWDIIDRLSENPDLTQFISDIKGDARVDKIKSEYDKVYYDDVSAAEYARKNKYIELEGEKIWDMY